MKLSKIGLIVITLFATKNAVALDVFISGTTAMRDLTPLVMNKICQTTLPRSLYEAAPSISGSTGKVASNSATVAIEDPDRRAFKCHTHSATTNSTVATALGVNADKDLTVYMSSEYGDSQNGNGGPLDNLLGGTITGIAPLSPYLSPATKQATVRFIDTSSGCSLNGNADVVLGTANGNNALGVPAKGYGFVGATKYICTNQISGHASEIGVSEVEPSKFTMTYQNIVSNLDPTLNIDEWQNFDVSGLARYSPTNNHSPYTKPAFVSTYGIVVQDVVPASTVSLLTQMQLANILSGWINNWKFLGGPDLPIKLCTRPPGTGIKSLLNQMVSHAGCGANVLGMEYVVLNPDAIRNGSYYSIPTDDMSIAGLRENKTTRDMQNCMTDNRLATGELTLAGGGSEANVGAIGFMGLDSVPNIPVNAGYHFIAYNGINPVDLTKALDTQDGKADGVRKDIISIAYSLWAESTIQISPSVIDANKVAFFNYLASHVGDLEFTNQLPSLLTLDDYRAGDHTSPSRGDMYYTRNGDMCNPESFQ